MGWCGGSDLLASVAKAFETAAPRADETKKVAFYVSVIKAFERSDADTLHECKGISPALDAALKKTRNG